MLLHIIIWIPITVSFCYLEDLKIQEIYSH